MQPTPPARTSTVCSAKGCRTSAVWALRWNNPRLHDPLRRKTWMACESHRGGLSDFLSVRGFLRESVRADLMLDPAVAARDAAADRDLAADLDSPTRGAAVPPR